MLYTPYSFACTYLTRFSGLLSRTSSSGLGFGVDFCSYKWTQRLCLIFLYLYSTKFPHQLHGWRNSHFRHLINSTCQILMTELRTAKKISQGSSLVYHVTCYFFFNSYIMNSTLRKINRWPIHYVTKQYSEVSLVTIENVAI